MTSKTMTAKASIRIHKPAAEVMAAITSAEKMSKFWFARSDDGLKQGEAVTFTMGSGDTAFSFAVMIKELVFPRKLVFEWAGPDGHATQVCWTCEETKNGDTILAIEESGFAGNDQSIIARVIDSTGGFNQVIVAAKACIEHDVAINLVNDRA